MKYFSKFTLHILFVTSAILIFFINDDVSIDTRLGRTLILTDSDNSG